MRVILTTDEKEIRSVIEHPNVRPQLIEGDEVLPVPMIPTLVYLIGKVEHHGDGAVEDKIVGIIVFQQINAVTWTPHLGVIKQGRGYGTEMLRAGMNWLFENSSCLKFFAAPPRYNNAMIRCFEKCGFHHEGTSPKSFLWHGRLHDRILMGFEKEHV